MRALTFSNNSEVQPAAKQSTITATTTTATMLIMMMTTITITTTVTTRHGEYDQGRNSAQQSRRPRPAVLSPAGIETRSAVQVRTKYPNTECNFFGAEKSGMFSDAFSALCEV